MAEQLINIEQINDVGEIARRFFLLGEQRENAAYQNHRVAARTWAAAGRTRSREITAAQAVKDALMRRALELGYILVPRRGQIPGIQISNPDPIDDIDEEDDIL